MPIPIKKFLIGTLLAAFLSLLLMVGMFWSLAGTRAGTQWLAERLARVSGDALAWEQLEGNLLQSLQVQGLRLRLDGMVLDIQTLNLDWRPSLIATGTVQVDHIAANGILLALTDGPEADSPGGPFDPSALDLPIDIILERLELRNIELRLGENPPRSIDTVTLSARLQNHQLTLNQLGIRAPEGGLVAKGDIALIDAMPVNLDLQWDWRLPDQQLGGHLQAMGDPNAMGIEYFGRGDIPIKLRGTLSTLLTQPRWEIEASWPEMTVPAGLSPLSVAPGWLRTEGTPEDYRIASEGQLRAQGLETVKWLLTAQGTLEGIELQPLTLTSGPYELALSGAVTWQGPVGANLSYRAKAEELSALNPQLPPRLGVMGTLAARFEDETLTLEHFDLALEQAPLQVHLKGSVQFPAAGDPIIAGELHWEALQWPIAVQAADAAVASPEGRAVLAGTADAWNVDLSLQLAGSRVPAGEWLGHGEGDRSELRLEYLQGKLLEGTFVLGGLLGWDPAPRWNLEGSGENLNPGVWQPDFPGHLAFNFQSEGIIDPQSGPRGTFALGELTGELLGRPLSLAGKGALAGDNVQLESLTLASGNNRFSARGQLGGQRLALDWTIQARELGLLLPGAAGSLEGGGRVEGSPGSPRLRAQLSGRELQIDDKYLPELTASLQVGLAAEAPLQVDIGLGPLRQGEQTLVDSARLTATGTTASHQLELDVQTLSEQVQMRLEGGLDVELSIWRGRLAAMNIVSAGLGNWELAQAASLAAAPDHAELGDTCLQSGAPEHSGNPSAQQATICAGGEWSPAQGAHLELNLKSFALTRLLPELTGEINGDLQGALAPDGALTGRANFTVSPGQMQVETSQGSRQLAHGGGRLNLTVDSDGLAAALDFKPLQDGQLQAELTLPQMNRMPLADVQPLAGRIQAEFPDLSGLQGWVPNLEAVAGRLDADIRLGGDLQRPEIKGELALTEGAASIPVAGLRLRDVQLRVRDDPMAPGEMLLSGGLLSGEGRLELNGRFRPSGDMLALALTGEDLAVFDTPDAQVLVSPDLNIAWGDELLRLRGRVVVPRANITPKLGLSPGLASEEASPGAANKPEIGEIIAPSADVVVIGLEGEPVVPPGPTVPFRLDSQVQLVLGEEVRVSALGFAGRIAGKVTFRNQPDQVTAIPNANGSLSIEDGSFRAFGQDLDIETGKIIFRKVPVTEPEVNLRAVRWIDNDPLVSAAGVQVSGPLAAPVMELFSRPQLDPTEIQSYLLTGHSASGGDSVLSIGAYLYPKLYVSYGYNLIEQTNEFNGLYTITPRYGIETSVGEADNSVGVTITYEH